MKDNLFTVKLNQVLNYAEINRLFSCFYSATGLSVALFDCDGNIELAYRGEKCICDLAKDNVLCRKSIKYGGEKAKELGEPYIFATECGLIMCTFPVVFNEKILGTIACGPVRLWDDDDYNEQEVAQNIAKLNISSGSVDFSQVKQLTCVNMTGCAQMLRVLVDYICASESKYYEQRLEIINQNKKFDELIKQLGKRNLNASAAEYPKALERELLNCFRMGDRLKTKKLLNDLLGQIFFFAEGDLDTIKIKLFELTAFLSRSAVEAGASLKNLSDTIKMSSQLLKDEADFQEVCSTTTVVMDSYLEAVSSVRGRKQPSEHLARATDFIRDNFSDEITLDSLANSVFVSSYYLSHLFRDELGVTFSDYLANVRIDEAKKILDRQDCTNEQLSERVGYSDAGYFAKTFKKLTGLTTSQYRSAKR